MSIVMAFAVGFIAGFLVYTLVCLATGQKWDWRIALVYGLTFGLLALTRNMASIIGLGKWGSAAWYLSWTVTISFWSGYRQYYITHGVSGGAPSGYGGFWSNHYG